MNKYNLNNIIFDIILVKKHIHIHVVSLIEIHEKLKHFTVT